jgi:hypothetical protein
MVIDNYCTQVNAFYGHNNFLFLAGVQDTLYMPSKL